MRATPSRFTPGKGNLTYFTRGWLAPGQVGTGTENLTPPGFDPRNLHRLASRHADWSTPLLTAKCVKEEVDCVWNVMAHAQKPHFFFPRNGRVHLSRRGRQFSRLLAAEVCASAVVMLDTSRSEVVWEYWLPTPIASFLFTSPPVRHRVPSGFKRTLPFASSGIYLPSVCVCLCVENDLVQQL